DLILHIDKYLGEVIRNYGALVYVLICAIVFCETGLVVMFFLPGDTLLFIGGAFCASGAISVWALMGLLIVAAVSGSTLNYWIGSFIGHKVFTHNYRWLDRDALQKTHAFYEKYGGITMVLSRFIPVVRSFAPFVAGVSEMTFAKFQTYNISGAVLWVIALVSLGYFFGNVPIFHDHLNTIILIGVGIAVVPVVLGSLWRFATKMSRK
ncbi:MAG TPA: VTT domain-containing protein, partial [Burkholderiaceae bacterium]|nr:VTT domain-containing protein [Burkholderiaceae bacterium]